MQEPLYCPLVPVLIVCLSIRSEYECFQIELAKNYGQTEWREDIKSIMLKAGLQNKQITFLFVDTQVNNSMQLSPAAVYSVCGSLTASLECCCAASTYF